MTKTGFAAVDLGASSGRVMVGVIDDEEFTLHEVHRFPNAVQSVGDRLVWNVEELFAQTVEGLRLAVEMLAADNLELSGIGVDSWGVDYALVSAQGDVRAQVGSYRAAAPADDFISRRAASVRNVYATTGVLDQSINTVFQLMADVDAGRAKPGDRVLLIPDFWVYLLTDAMGAEATIASTTQLLDRSTGEWSQELVSAHSLDDIIFPGVQVPGTLAGHTTPGMTSRIHAKSPVPVFRVAGHDTASALAFAAPATTGASTTALVSSGSWSLVGFALDSPILGEEAQEAGFTNELGAFDVSLLIRNLSGMWVLQDCLAVWSEEDGMQVDLASLLDAAHESETSERVFDPSDERLLATGDMPGRVRAMAVEAGRPEPITRAETVRAVLDSLAASYADAIRSAERISGRRAESVRIVGGGSRNALLCQLTADRSGLRVIAGPIEASSLGNIAVQIVGAGIRRNLDSVYQLALARDEMTSYYPSASSDSIEFASTPKAHR